MRAVAILLISLAPACAKAGPVAAQDFGHKASGRPLITAAALINDFYSFDPIRLRNAMTNATGSMGDIVYYQGWAEAGNYVVLERKPCRFEKADEVICGVTVKDDLAPALGISYHVTDTFHFAFRDGRIVKVWNSSDDPPEFHQAMVWLRRNRPKTFTGPCRGMWEGGPTPQLCVRAIVKGFVAFTARH